MPLTGEVPGTRDVQGTCDARFLPVRDAFAENFARRGELGAAVAVIVEGRAVVDLWGGWMDGRRSRPWREDTLVNVFSVGKAVAALCVLMLVSRGQLELDEAVARRWPAFGAAGKEEVTVRQLLSHRAGLAAIEPQLALPALYEWDLMASALAAQAPWWAPGSAHGYHVHTFGFLAGELVRRAGGEPIGHFMCRELSDVLGAELSLGLARGKRRRCAEYVFAHSVDSTTELARGFADAPPLRRRAYLNPEGATGVGTVNTGAWRDAEIPSANLHADGRGIARLYAALLSPQRELVAPEVLSQATREAAAGEDAVLGRPSRFGLGFQLTQPERPLGPNSGSFGHFGAGGSLGFADPRAQVAFAYVMNRGGPQWQDPRNRALIDAVYASLAG